jgi:prepilin-type N-terminal cleavage/methylation domain-containing protein
MRKGFTLIELLVVIGIIAILFVVVIFAINPAVLLEQARDSSRMSDMTVLNNNVKFASEAGVGYGISLGSPNTVYVSIPDPVATSTAGDQCQGLGLNTLPSGWAYHCAASSTYRNVNGTGWVPINFTTLPGGSPSGALPVDPVNQTSTFLYYTYVTDTSSEYQLYAHFESPSYQVQETTAGTPGIDPETYKLGTNVNIAPFAGGLAADWPMNEGSGAMIYDQSGDGYNGTINGATWITSGCAAGSTSCLSFNGTSNYVTAAAGIVSNPALTVCSWVWMTSTGNSLLEQIIGDGDTSELLNSGDLVMGLSNDGSTGINTQGRSVAFDSWHYLCGTRNSNVSTNLYIDGSLAVSWNGGGFRTSGQGTTIGAYSASPTYVEFMYGNISGIRVYNRVLSSQEIQSLYSAGG